MTVLDIRFIFQIASTIIILLVIAIQVKRLKNKDGTGYPLAILFWMLHGLIFYIFVFLQRFYIFDIYEHFSTNTWSSVLRFHAYVTIFCIEISRLKLISFRKTMED